MAYSDGSSGASDEDLDLDPSLFQEPSGYLKPEEPAKFIEHTLHSGQTLRLRLVGHNPLWVHTISFLSLPLVYNADAPSI